LDFRAIFLPWVKMDLYPASAEYLVTSGVP